VPDASPAESVVPEEVYGPPVSEFSITLKGWDGKSDEMVYAAWTSCGYDTAPIVAVHVGVGGAVGVDIATGAGWTVVVVVGTGTGGGAAS